MVLNGGGVFVVCFSVTISFGGEYIKWRPYRLYGRRIDRNLDRILTRYLQREGPFPEEGQRSATCYATLEYPGDVANLLLCVALKPHHSRSNKRPIRSNHLEKVPTPHSVKH